ncbi:MAG: DUF1858 domain-containing protein [Bacteroidales bacterium]
MKRAITLQTKVWEFLEDYPELEGVLLDLSPAFAKLRNPILRRTIAKVTSLQQAATIAGIPAGELVMILRRAAGENMQPNGIGTSESDAKVAGNESEDSGKYTGERPEWFSPEKVVKTFDAVSVLNSGDVPMSQILKSSGELLEGEIYEFRTPFLPTPILDMLNGKGYKIWSEKEENSDSGEVIYLNRISR